MTVSCSLVKVEKRRAWKDPLEEEGLFFKILACVPVLKLSELRTVCKLWNYIITSRAFLKMWFCKHKHGDDGEPATCCSPWLLMVRHPPGAAPLDRELVVFDSGLGKWISLRALLRSSCAEAALASLGGPSLPLVANLRSCPIPTLFLDFMAHGSQAGLICFLCSPLSNNKEEYFVDKLYYTCFALDLNAFYLVVLNPLTGSHGILPPPLKHTFTLEEWDSTTFSLQVLPDGQYRVFLKTLDYDYPGDLEIYDSSSGSWKAGRSCWSLTDAKVGGAKEFERADLLLLKRRTGFVFAYNVELDDWSQVCKLPSPIHEETGHFWQVHGTTLVRHRGRLLVAKVQFDGRFEPTAIKGFAVFELHPHAKPPFAAEHPVVGADWVEVARTPCQLWEGLYEVDTSRNWLVQVKIISSGSLICMTAYHYQHGGESIYGGTYYVPLVYDLDGDSWYHLPPYKGNYDVGAVSGMRPSLASVA